MKIVFVNQHGANRGDHAAFISQIEFINKTYPNIEKLTVVYNSTSNAYSTDKLCKYEVIHVPDVRHSIFTRVLFRIISLFDSLSKTTLLSSYLRNISKILEQADLIYLSNGGANIGVYRDWKYLCKLTIAANSRAKLRSFGNSCNESGSIRFDNTALSVIRKFDRYCARDLISQKYLLKNKVPFQKTLDVVFLKAESLIGLYENSEIKNYVVFVPNEVYKWHPEFVGCDDLFNTYVDLINRLTDSGYNVVMLPQLFGDNHLSDFDFFNRLAKSINEKSMVKVCAESTEPAEQISIIRGSRLVIGGRYHSIVFSIVTNTPFISFSYEEKMEGMLDFLNLPKYNIQLKKLELDTVQRMIEEIETDYESVKSKISQAAIVANATVVDALRVK